MSAARIAANLRATFELSAISDIWAISFNYLPLRIAQPLFGSRGRRNSAKTLGLAMRLATLLARANEVFEIGPPSVRRPCCTCSRQYIAGSHDQGLIVKMFKDGDPK